MDDLIAKLEAAEGGSRELSDMVLDFLGWDIPATPGGGGILLPDSICCRSADGVKMPLEDRPCVTTSLDAALTLVPKGRSIKTAYLPMAHWPWRAWVFPNGTMPPEHEMEKPALGHNAAVALCIAALKARLHSETKETSAETTNPIS